MQVTHIVELASILVLAFFLWMEHRGGKGGTSPVATQVKLGLTLAGCAWLTENSCIHLYGFYYYTPTWHVMLDQVPLMVILIWPFVILSDLKVAQGLLGAEHKLIPILTGALVVWDASLMEAVSSYSGLWWWTEPGLFEVPLIGILGWGIFTVVVLGLWRNLGPGWRVLIFVNAPLYTHLLLLAAWWGGLRYVLRGPFPDGVVVGLGWVVSFLLSWQVWRRRLRLPTSTLWPRIPAALVFFSLLWVYGRSYDALMAYTFSFAPPWILLTWQSVRGESHPLPS